MFYATENDFFSARVREFMETAGQPVHATRHKPTEAEMIARDDFFQEEVNELEQAIEDNNKVEMLDALADIIYIAVGTAWTYGTATLFSPERQFRAFIRGKKSNMVDFRVTMSRLLTYLRNMHQDAPGMNAINVVFIIAHNLGFTPSEVLRAFDLVHKSNMTKFCRTEEEARSTIQKYRSDGFESYFEKMGNGLFVVKRVPDRKVLKSINYEPVSLEGLIK